jgi:transcriptional regulator with XRE-family HTH domain
MNVDHERLACELVRALRGTRSQVQLSRRLGFTTNAIYSWEAGRRWPSATRFFYILTRTGHDLPECMAPFFKRPPHWLGDEPGSAAWVAALFRELRGSTPIGVLADQAGISRFALSRWLSGRAEPRLPQLLALVGAATQRLLDFVALFVPPQELPSIRRQWQRLEAARELAWVSPWAQVVWLALELEEYRALPSHDDAWLGARLGLDEAVVHECVQHLHAAHHIRRDGKRYRPVEMVSVDVRRARSGSELKAHWARTGLDRLDTPDGMVSYNLFTVSTEVLAEIRELQRAHYRAVRRLVDSSTRAEAVVLMNLQRIPLDDGVQPGGRTPLDDGVKPGGRTPLDDGVQRYPITL